MPAFHGAKTGHGAKPFFRTHIKPIRATRFSLCRFLATLSARHLNSVLAVWRKHTMEPCEVCARLGRQGCGFLDKVQWPKDDMCGTIGIRGFQFIANLSVGGLRQALL